MAWAPTEVATDVRAVVGNLFAYIAANQTAALTWSSPSTALADLTLYRTAEVRAKTDFPHLGIVRRRITTDDQNDGLHVRYELTFEMEIAAEFAKDARTDALTQLQADSDNYSYAIESMLVNIPNATLFASVRGTKHGRKTVTTNDPLEVAVSETKALFNTQITWALECVQSPYN
jgi:hypothetical protein